MVEIWDKVVQIVARRSRDQGGGITGDCSEISANILHNELFWSVAVSENLVLMVNMI